MSLHRVAFSLRKAPRASIRSFQTSPVAFKKKPASRVDSDVDDEDDLFAVNYGSRSSGGAVASSHSSQTSANNLSALRTQKFLDHKATIEYRCDRKGLDGKKRPQPRIGSLKRLVFLADTPQELETVADTLALWRQAGHPPCQETSSFFIGRCINLRRPDIALKVLASRPRYGVDLPSLSVARALLHSILASSLEGSNAAAPFTDSHANDALLLVGLLPRFQLTEASQDPLCSYLLFAISSNHASSTGLGLDALQEIKVHWGNLKKSGQLLKTQTNNVVQLSAQETIWMAASRARVEKFIVSQGADISWLDGSLNQTV